MYWRPRQLGWLHRTSLRNIQRSSEPNYGRITILFGLQKRLKSTTPQLLQPLTRFLGDPDSGLLCFDQHRLSLSIAKKYLDDHRFLTAEKTTDRAEPGFKVGDRVYFKNKTPGKWDLKLRAGYRIIQIECKGHYLHIENQATGKIRSCNVKDIVLGPISELWNVNPEFGRASKFINCPNNLPDFTPDTQ